jgi:hypothetical protein
MRTLRCPQCNRAAEVAAPLPRSEWVCPACHVTLDEVPGSVGEPAPSPALNLKALGEIALGLLAMFAGLYLLAEWILTPDRLLFDLAGGYWLPQPVAGAALLAVGLVTVLGGWWWLRH